MHPLSPKRRSRNKREKITMSRSLQQQQDGKGCTGPRKRRRLSGDPQSANLVVSGRRHWESGFALLQTFPPCSLPHQLPRQPLPWGELFSHPPFAPGSLQAGGLKLTWMLPLRSPWELATPPFHSSSQCTSQEILLRRRSSKSQVMPSFGKEERKLPLKTESSKFVCHDLSANIFFIPGVDSMLPVVGVSSSMNERSPVRIDATDHTGFHD